MDEINEFMKNLVSKFDEFMTASKQQIEKIHSDQYLNIENNIKSLDGKIEIRLAENNENIGNVEKILIKNMVEMEQRLNKNFENVNDVIDNLTDRVDDLFCRVDDLTVQVDKFEHTVNIVKDDIEYVRTYDYFKPKGSNDGSKRTRVETGYKGTHVHEDNTMRRSEYPYRR